MPYDVLTPMITINPSLRDRSLGVRNKVAHVELLRGLARPVTRYAVTVIYGNQQRKKTKNIFCPPKKKSNAKDKKKIMTAFGKSLFLIKYRMRSKYKRPRNKPNDGCLCKPVKRNSVRASEQL